MFYWIAHYKTGEQYRQGDFAKIHRCDLVAFDLRLEAGDGLVLRVDLADDSTGDDRLGPKRLIYRKRTRQQQRGGQVEQGSYHLVGWQRKVNGVNVQSINYVFEGGGIVLGGQFVETDFRHSIQPYPFEDDLI